MNNGIYAAATGMLTQSRVLDVTANNMANIDTAGYKRDRLLTSTFGEHVVSRYENNMAYAADGTVIGSQSHGAIPAEIVTDTSQGVMETTDRNLDFAIMGEGYFSVESEDGEAAITRSGRFHTDTEGYLRTESGYYVLGENGRIQLTGGDVSAASDGSLLSNGQDVGKFAIVVPDEGAATTKIQDSLLTQQNGTGTFSGRVLQGVVERSNVDMVEEMTSMMQASRAFQSCAQAVKILDTISQKTSNEIGKL